MAGSPLFARCEVAIYRVGGWVSALSRALGRLHPAIQHALVRYTEVVRKLLVHAGEPLGLEPASFVALSLLVGALFFALAWLFGSGDAGALGCAVGLLGLALPLVRCSSLRLDRFKQASRELPVTIELVALGMGAGLDFPGAVRRVTSGQTGVVAEELGHLLLTLDLGIGRAAALATLEERLPVSEVRDLVRVVTLADKKGASVSDALTQLAEASRAQRSIRAEEAAARAGVLLLGPLMLLLLCILILLLAPLLVGGVGF